MIGNIDRLEEEKKREQNKAYRHQLSRERAEMKKRHLLQLF